MKCVNLYKFCFDRWEAEVCLCVWDYSRLRIATWGKWDSPQFRSEVLTQTEKNSSNTQIIELCTCFNTNQSETLTLEVPARVSVVSILTFQDGSRLSATVAKQRSQHILLYYMLCVVMTQGWPKNKIKSQVSLSMCITQVTECKYLLYFGLEKLVKIRQHTIADVTGCLGFFLQSISNVWIEKFPWSLKSLGTFFQFGLRLTGKGSNPLLGLSSHCFGKLCAKQLEATLSNKISALSHLFTSCAHYLPCTC